jgi:hypothetical protein
MVRYSVIVFVLSNDAVGSQATSIINEWLIEGFEEAVVA